MRWIVSHSSLCLVFFLIESWTGMERRRIKIHRFSFELRGKMKRMLCVSVDGMLLDVAVVIITSRLIGRHVVGTKLIIGSEH